MQGDYFNNSSHGRIKSQTGWGMRSGERTGFGPAGSDDTEQSIDLNEYLVHNKTATYFLRVQGDAMNGAGIYDGDIVIVDRSLKAISGKIVIALLNGEMLIRRLEQTFNKMRLLPETPKLAPIEVDAGYDSFSIWGVVTYTIHAV